MYIDWTYIILVVPAMLFALWADSKVKSTFREYSRVGLSNSMTGYDAARLILDANGLYDVKIEHISGNLTDHYDPKLNVVRLSDSVYNCSTPAAVGVAAHECGHAIQNAVCYFPIKIRTAIVPITNIGSKLSTPLITLGLLLSMFGQNFIQLAYLGVICFGLCVLFQLITLPTEFNASNRAVSALQNSNCLYKGELKGVKKVLTAAALTYVAALAVSIMQMLRLLLIVVSRDRRRD